MEKPVLSPDFTIEDIHKLREYNYYQTKEMKPQERMRFCIIFTTSSTLFCPL